MAELELSVWVPGRPRPQGSAGWIPSKSTGKAVPRKAPGEVEHRTAMAWRLAHEWGWPPLDGPVRAHARFTFERPKSHYRTGRNSSTLKASAPDAHTQAPDLDKLARLVGDALVEARVIADDALIVAWRLEKVWVDRGEGEGTLVSVSGLSSVLAGAMARHPSVRGGR